MNPPRRPDRDKKWGDNSPTSTREQADRQEKRLVGKMGLRQTTNSGATGWAAQKGDAQSSGMLMESKTTTKGSVSVSRRILAKAGREAAALGLDPVLVLTYEGDLPPGMVRDYAVIPLGMFLELSSG